MKLDFSTILLIVVALIPGLFAQRTRNQLVPRSFAQQGASSELAELVALGVATHGTLAFLLAAILALLGWMRQGNPDYFFSKLDSPTASLWCSQHILESFLIASAYIFLSFFFSHWLGFIYGIMRLKSPLTTMLFARARKLQRSLGVSDLLSERPIVYEVLNPELDHGEKKSVFIEVEMKNGLGFYSGQLSQFSIVRDEEPHKLIYLIDVWFKKERRGDYEQVETDGIMIDLAETATVLVKQMNELEPVAPSNPTEEEIASLAHQLWIENGCKDGTAEQDWLRAEMQLKQQ